MLELIANATFWLSLACFVVVVMQWLRGRTTEPGALRAADAVRRFATSVPVVIALALGTLLTVALALDLGHAAPRDIIQDIISARQVMAGKPAFPISITDLVQRALQEEPARFSLGDWVPALRARELESYRQSVHAPWLQAHPPAATLVIAPFVFLFGIHGTYLAMFSLSLGALWLTFNTICRELGWVPAGRTAWVIALALLGWHHLAESLRLGQWDLILGTLLVLGWCFLRRQRPAAAGLAIAGAVTLKLFPGLMLVYLWFRHRKAFWWAAIATAVLVTGSLVMIGRQNAVDYFHGTQYVVHHYKDFPTNLSLLSWFGVLPIPWNRSELGIRLYYLLALGLVVTLAWMFARVSPRSEGKSRKLDLEYSVFVALMPLLSPVAWDHYLVLLLLPFAILSNIVFSEPGHERQVLGLFGIFLVATVPQSAWDGLAQALGSTASPRLLHLLPKVSSLMMAALILLLTRMRLASPAHPAPAAPMAATGGG